MPAGVRRLCGVAVRGRDAVLTRDVDPVPATTRAPRTARAAPIAPWPELRSGSSATTVW
jgi:hypothetical protein